MSWWVILLIIFAGIMTVIACFGMWLMLEFTKGMDEAFGYSKKYRWWK